MGQMGPRTVYHNAGSDDEWKIGPSLDCSWPIMRVVMMNGKLVLRQAVHGPSKYRYISVVFPLDPVFAPLS